MKSYLAGGWGVGVALGDSVEFNEITPGELIPAAGIESGTPAAGSPPIFTDIWQSAAML